MILDQHKSTTIYAVPAVASVTYCADADIAFAQDCDFGTCVEILALDGNAGLHDAVRSIHP